MVRLAVSRSGVRLNFTFVHSLTWSFRRLHQSQLTRRIYENSKRKGRTLSSSITHDLTAVCSNSSPVQSPALPPLACPGGPRMKSSGIKYLYKVPHAGYLAKYDQRFVLNLKLTHQLATYLTQTTMKTGDKLILELGPGPGSLTRSLLTRPSAGILGIESDLRFNPHLQQISNFTNGKFKWVNADVLRASELSLLRSAFPEFVRQHQRRPPADSGVGQEEVEYDGAPLRSPSKEKILRERLRRSGRTTEKPLTGAAFESSTAWWAQGDAKLEVVANLPFHLISELMVRYAVDCSRREGVFVFGRVPLHLFTQREIAERIVAPAGSLHFSRLSVIVQCFFHVRVKQTFSEWTYYPKTEVQGALLTLEPKSTPLAAGLDGAMLLHFVEQLLPSGKRGSSVFKALSRFSPPEMVQYMLQEVRVDGAVAVLDLSMEEIVKLASLWRQFVVASHPS